MKKKVKHSHYVENFLYICNVIHTNKSIMATKKTIDNAVDIKRSISSLRKLLADDPKRHSHKIRFKKYGSKYIITDNNNDLATKLEKSFNTFMGKLNVNSEGKKMRGICFLDKKSDDFNIGYQKEGEFVLHQIKGKLG